MHKVSAAEAREKISDLINRVAYSKERVVLTRHGKDVAALVSVEDLQRLEDLAFQAALNEGNEKYSGMLQRLAE